MNKTIGIFYGSSTCYTEMVAEKIHQWFNQQLGSDQCHIHNIADTPVAVLGQYKQLILGIPTWDYGELQEDWENIWSELDQLDLSHTIVALYGLGDQVGYPEWFLDALGYLHTKVTTLGAHTIGQWPTDGFTFTQSQALTPDGKHFVGLAIDDENQFELTDQRIHAWCQILLEHFVA